MRFDPNLINKKNGKKAEKILPSGERQRLISELIVKLFPEKDGPAVSILLSGRKNPDDGGEGFQQIVDIAGVRGGGRNDKEKGRNFDTMTNILAAVRHAFDHIAKLFATEPGEDDGMIAEIKTKALKEAANCVYERRKEMMADKYDKAKPESPEAKLVDLFDQFMKSLNDHVEKRKKDK